MRQLLIHVTKEKLKINNQDVTTEMLKEKYHAQVSSASDQPSSQQEVSTNQEMICGSLLQRC